MEFYLHAFGIRNCSLGADCFGEANVSKESEPGFFFWRASNYNNKFRNVIFLQSKGQESAPFELLVAVLIMGFVLVMGFMAIQQQQQNQCAKTNEAVLEQLKTGLQLVAEGKGTATVNLDLTPCTSSNKGFLLTMKTQADATLCARRCSTPRPTCLLLDYIEQGEGAYVTGKCLDISALVSFPTSTDTCAFLEDNMDLFDLKDPDGIRPGRYTFINATPTTTTAPMICAYRKTIK